MSQTTILESVSTWTVEECRQNIDQVLPTLFKQLQPQKETFLGALQLLCQSFIPVAELGDINSQIFEKMFTQVTSQFDHLLESVAQVVVNLSHQVDALQKITSHLEDLQKIVACVEMCVMRLLQEPVDMEVSSVHTLPPAVIHCMQSSYTHCKDSNIIYGDTLGAVSDLLSALFKKTHSLQMNFITLLDKLSASSYEQDILCLCSVLNGLYTISQIAMSLDVKIMITMWKTISRLACQHKALLCDRLELAPMLRGLADHITSSYEYLIQLLPTQESSGDDRAFGRNVKILGFEMKVLVTLVREYDGYLGDCINSIYKAILTVQSHVSVTLENQIVTKTYIDEIEKQVAAAIEPLVTTLINSPDFTSSATKVEQDLSDNLRVPYCLTLLAVVNQLPSTSEKTQAVWMQPTQNPEDELQLPIFMAIFQAFRKCYVELQIPIYLVRTVEKRKKYRLVSLYENMCSQLSAFAACCPAQCFNFLESCLLQQVLSRHNLSALLATDIWAFQARYGTAELCRDQVLELANLLNSIGLSDTPECNHLVLLLSRLIKFLAPEHQVDLIKAFPVEENFEMWSVLPLSSLAGSALHLEMENIIQACIKQMQDWLQSCEKSPHQTEKLTYCLGCLCGVYSHPPLVEQHIGSSFHATIIDGFLQLCYSFDAECVVQYQVLQSLTCKMLQLGTSLTSHMESEETIKMLNWVNSLHKEKSDAVAFNILDMLFACRKNTFQSSTEVISELFGKLLGSSNCLVHQAALEIFAQFAEDTPHESVVPDSLERNENVRDLVVGYLSQLASGDVCEPSPDILQLGHQFVACEEYWSTSANYLYPSCAWLADHVREPASKRPKLQLEDPLPQTEQTRMEEICYCLEKNVLQMESISQQQEGLPEWLCQRLKPLAKKLQTLTSNSSE